METLERSRPAPWDPGSPQIIADPYASYAWLRRNAPVWRNDFAWVISRYDDVQAALTDPRLGTVGRDGKNSKEVSLDLPPPIGERTRAHKRRWLMFKHGDAHKGLRRIMNRGFTPGVLDEMRPMIADLIHGLLNEVRQETSFDFISRFAVPVPVTVISELFGMPEEHRPALHDLLAPLSRTMTGVPLTAAEMTAVDDAVIRFEDIIRDLVIERRKRPTDDLFSALVHPSEADKETLSDDEVVANAGVLLFAGHETTVGLFGNSLLALMRHPEQREMLRRDPDLTRNAVEELMRYDAPVQWVGRVAHEELEIRGQRIMPDELVWILMGSASRDPEAFEEPDRLDLTRPGIRPIAFGRGPHMCLGQPLARLEAQIAMPAILDALKDFQLDEQEIRYNPSSTLRCPSALRLTRA